MSEIINGGGGGGSGTVSANNTAAGAVANYAAAGGSTTVGATTLNYVAPTLTVGTATDGNGVLALSGSTSGTATFTAPAVAGTTTNPVTSSNCLALPVGAAGTPSITIGDAAVGFYRSAANVWTWVSGSSNKQWSFRSTSMAMGSTGILCWTTTGNDSTATIDTGLSRSAAAIVSVGNGTQGNKTGLLLSGMTVFVTADFTTSGVGTALEAITGLAITVPAFAANWSFHAHLAYSQAVGTAAVGFGIQAQTNAPTNIFATGEMFTAAGTVTTGVLATLATTTATQIVSGTPGATGTNFVCDLYGTAELGASANTIRLLVSTATAADLVTIKRGSYFSFCP